MTSYTLIFLALVAILTTVLACRWYYRRSIDKRINPPPKPPHKTIAIFASGPADSYAREIDTITSRVEIPRQGGHDVYHREHVWELDGMTLVRYKYWRFEKTEETR